MPKFEIEAGGRRFEVEAPSHEEALAAVEGVGPQPKSFGLGDTWPARMAKSIWGGITLPRDVYQGKVDPLSDEAIGRSADLAAVAIPMGPRSALSLGKRGPPTSQELLAAGKHGYEQARGMGVDIAPASVKNWASTVGTDLERAGLNDILAPETFKILKRAQDIPDGAVAASLDNIVTLRDTLRNAGQNFQNPREQLAATRAIKSLDDYLASVPQGDVLAGDAAAAANVLSTARGNYAAGKRSESIADAQRAAELGAAAANSGRNIGNAERQKFKSVLLNEERSQGFNPQELEQLERVVRGTRPANAARYTGNLLGGGGGLGQAVTSGLGAALGSVGGPVGAGIGAVAAPMLGVGARALGNKLTEKQIRILDEMVRSRSPLAENLSYSGLSPGQEARRRLLARALLEYRPTAEQLSQQ